MTDYTLNLYTNLDTDPPDSVRFTASNPALDRSSDGWTVTDGERGVVALVLDCDYSGATITATPVAGPGVLPTPDNHPDPLREFGLLAGADGRFHQAPPIADPIHWEGTPLERLRKVAPGKFVRVNINNPDPKPTGQQIADAMQIDVLMGACGVDRQKAALKSLIADVKSLTEPTWLDEDALEELPPRSLILVRGESRPRERSGDGSWEDLADVLIDINSVEASPARLLWTPEGDK